MFGNFFPTIRNVEYKVRVYVLKVRTVNSISVEFREKILTRIEDTRILVLVVRKFPSRTVNRISLVLIVEI